MRFVVLSALALVTATSALRPLPALAWGREGHEVIAYIAEAYLTPSTRQKVEALLATDTDDLTAHDLASESYWADEYREHGHSNTRKWHYVDLELSGPDLMAACYGFPPAADPPYFGAENDCVVDKIEELDRDLSAPDVIPARRLRDLKFLIHFVGDLHQPLHAADNLDRGGNCVEIVTSTGKHENLHAYWDVDVVSALGPDPAEVAAQLRAKIAPADVAAWQKGGPRDWSMESFEVAKRVAYPPGSPAGCERGREPISLPEGYEIAADVAASLQLQKAGLRLAWMLNEASGTD